MFSTRVDGGRCTGGSCKRDREVLGPFFFQVNPVDEQGAGDAIL